MVYFFRSSVIFCCSRWLKPVGSSNASPSPISRTVFAVPSRMAVQCLQALKWRSRRAEVRDVVIDIVGDLAPGFQTAYFHHRHCPDSTRFLI
jgi:hypothetical protein